jgi:hypothetical protein
MPLLSSVAARPVMGQGEAAPAPKRLIVMFTHYGCLTDLWFPENSHGALTASDLTGTSIEALAPHVDKLLLPRGIRAMNQWTSDMSLGQGNDTHTQVVGSYFTCVPVTPNSDDPFSFVAATKFNAMPTAPSLDHVCAKQLHETGIPLFMRVGNRSDNAQSAISYSAGEEPFDGIGTAEEAFAEITGLFVSEGALTPDSYEVLRGKSVVDLVRADLETLERHDMSTADKRKLEAWKDLLTDTTAVIRSSQCSKATATELGLTGDNLQLRGGEDGIGDISLEVADGLDSADVFSNIAALAALCDHSRVIFLKYPPTYVFGGLGLDTESHSLSHRLASWSTEGQCVDGVLEWIQTIDRWYSEKFAHLVGVLDSLEEGDGTLLDNTAAVWFQELSDGNAHNLNNMPIVQAGSCGGYFKTGRAVNVDDGTPDLHRGYSTVGCGGVPVPDSVTTTGTPAEFANAPINKYYCNLMNAVGVKAGADGFPAQGGTEEVTHYGMYDDTTDFVGGGVNPPAIKDPGGFEDLEA